MHDAGNPDSVAGTYWSDRPRRIGIWRIGPNGSHGPAFRVTFFGMWLFYLIPVVISMTRGGRGPLYTAGSVVIGVVFAAVYIAVVGWWDKRPQWSQPGVGMLFGLAFLACIVISAKASALWIYVAVAAGLALGKQRLAIRVIITAVACYTSFTLSAHITTGDFLSGLLPLLFGGLAAMGFRGRHELTRELMRARETVALLAASEERLRLARDMHDLTGQSLSTITLKCDVAARMLASLPASDSADRARAEIEQVADVSRQALRDVREALSGYRRPTLAVEVITARSALEAASIVVHDEAALTLLSGVFDADAEAALAWCLREAVTNVIRHSGARNCWLRLTHFSRPGHPDGGELVLEVRDDGVGAVPAAGEERRADEDHGGTHSGLRGMSERLSAIGGKLEVRPSSGGFALVATVPVDEQSILDTGKSASVSA
jgi:two-component system sensor histidine kinase DesK